MDIADPNPSLRRSPVALNLASVLLFCFGFLGLYWYVLHTFIYGAPFPAELRTAEFYVASIQAPELSLAQNADYERTSGMWEEARPAPAYFAIKTNLLLDRPPTADLGLVNQLQTDNYHIYVNGVPVRNYGALYPHASYHGQLVEISRISRGILRAGTNEIILLTARNAYSETTFFGQLIGEYERMLALSATRLFTYNTLKMTSAGVTAIIAVFALMLMLQISNRFFALSLALLAAALCLRNLFYFWHDFPLGDSVRAIYYFFLTNAVTLGWLGIICAWTCRRVTRLFVFSSYAFVVLMLAITLGFLLDYDRGYAFASVTTDVFSVVIACTAIALLVMQIVKSRISITFEAGMLLCGATLSLVDAYGYAVLNTALGHQDRAGFVLLLLLMALIFSRQFRLFESLESLNEHLSAQLRNRELELEAQFTKTRTAIRERDIAYERSRILRDMHDGVGGRLASLLARVKHQQISQGELAQSINDSIVDLRLLMDSLDAGSDSLETAVAVFHERMQSALKAQGVALSLDNELDPAGPELSHVCIVHIYRFLQEAVWNAVNHGKPTAIRIVLSRNTDDAQIHLTVTDDGQGFNPTTITSTGRGLGHMQSRALEIGATMDVDSSPGRGTRITLHLPEPACQN